MPNNPDDLARHRLARRARPPRALRVGRASGRAVGRDEAAAAVGVTRALAAFHLDRLVRDGLLIPEYRRLTGRTGPGAGRPAKLYRRAPRDVASRCRSAATRPRRGSSPRRWSGSVTDRTRGRPTSFRTPPARSARRPARRRQRRGRAPAQPRRPAGSGRGALRDRGYEPFTDDEATSACATARTMPSSTSTGRSSAA